MGEWRRVGRVLVVTTETIFEVRLLAEYIDRVRSLTSDLTRMIWHFDRLNNNKSYSTHLYRKTFSTLKNNPCAIINISSTSRFCRELSWRSDKPNTCIPPIIFLFTTPLLQGTCRRSSRVLLSASGNLQRSPRSSRLTRAPPAMKTVWPVETGRTTLRSENQQMSALLAIVVSRIGLV